MGLFGKKLIKKTPSALTVDVPSDHEYEHNTDYDSKLWNPNQFAKEIQKTVSDEMIDVVKQQVLKGTRDFHKIASALEAKFSGQRFSRRYLRTVVQRAERDYFGSFNDRNRLSRVIEKQGYLSAHKPLEEGSAVESIFFTHPRFLNMLKLHPFLLFVDTTYKLDRSSWDLVTISGYSSVRQPFVVGIALIPRTTRTQLGWVMREFHKLCKDRSIEETPVFIIAPSKPLLSVLRSEYPKSAFLVDKYLLGFVVRTHYESVSMDLDVQNKFMSPWWDIIESDYDIEFSERTAAFQNRFKKKQPEQWSYAMDWPSTEKECVVQAWTSMHSDLHCWDGDRIRDIQDLFGEAKEAAGGEHKSLSAAFLAWDRTNHHKVDNIMTEEKEMYEQAPETPDYDFHSYFTDNELNVTDREMGIRLEELRLKAGVMFLSSEPKNMNMLYPAWRFKNPTDIVDFKFTEFIDE